MKEKPSIFEWVVFWIFIAVEIAIFVSRIIRPVAEIDQAENILYSTFEIIFSLYIGYFIQRLDSMRRFQESLKDYGLSAYRRIMDIRKSVDRTISQIERMSVDYPKERISDIRALRLILEGTFDTVESSISDWGEIIGQEIKKKERAEIIQEELEKSQEKPNLSEADKETIAALRGELNRINAELPLALKGLSLGKQLEDQKQAFYINYFETRVNSDMYITLHIRIDSDLVGGELERQLSDEEVNRIIDSQPLFCNVIMTDIETVNCLVYDKDKNQIGFVVNPLSDYELDYKYYVSELQLALSEMGFWDAESKIPLYKLTNLRYAGKSSYRTLILHLPVERDYHPRA